MQVTTSSSPRHAPAAHALPASAALKPTVPAEAPPPSPNPLLDAEAPPAPALLALASPMSASAKRLSRARLVG
ncbi:hypothetical protein BDN70DRAFT_935783 [Pholiota conissans]|uniref:Uncharacterized protein n=1 Tax=Pholiota conissans TaxID=109636 RepID=A0A9P5YXC1_9AGAR|nr:hypothetical protein BDN70DRAFT_935783 [Pholiota conissans]